MLSEARRATIQDALTYQVLCGLRVISALRGRLSQFFADADARMKWLNV
jgi:hypothetical protein